MFFSHFQSNPYLLCVFFFFIALAGDGMWVRWIPKLIGSYPSFLLSQLHPYVQFNPLPPLFLPLLFSVFPLFHVHLLQGRFLSPGCCYACIKLYDMKEAQGYYMWVNKADVQI